MQNTTHIMITAQSSLSGQPVHILSRVTDNPRAGGGGGGGGGYTHYISMGRAVLTKGVFFSESGTGCVSL